MWKQILLKNALDRPPHKADVKVCPNLEIEEKSQQRKSKPLLSPLTMHEYKIMKSRMSKELDVPKELEVYLLTVSREIQLKSVSSDRKESFFMRINFFKELQNYNVNNPKYHHFGRIYLGQNLKERNCWSGSMYLFIKKGIYFGTVWIDDDYSGGTLEEEELLLFAPNFAEFQIRFFMKDPKKYECKYKNIHIDDYPK